MNTVLHLMWFALVVALLVVVAAGCRSFHMEGTIDAQDPQTPLPILN